MCVEVGNCDCPKKTYVFQPSTNICTCAGNFGDCRVCCRRTILWNPNKHTLLQLRIGWNFLTGRIRLIIMKIHTYGDMKPSRLIYSVRPFLRKPIFQSLPAQKPAAFYSYVCIFIISISRICPVKKFQPILS